MCLLSSECNTLLTFFLLWKMLLFTSSKRGQLVLNYNSHQYTKKRARITTLKVLIDDSNVSFLCIHTSSTLSNYCVRSTNTSIISQKSREFNCANERRWTMPLTRSSSSSSTIIRTDWSLTCNSRSKSDALWKQNMSNDLFFFCFFSFVFLLLLNKTD